MAESRAMRSRGTISTKLLVSFAAVLVMVLAISDSAITAISSLGSSLHYALNGQAQKLQLFPKFLTPLPPQQP